LIDSGLQAAVQLLKFRAEMRFYARDRIEAPHERLGRIVKNLAQSLARGERSLGFAQGQYGEAVLPDAERQVPFGVAAPTIGPGDPDREVFVGPGVGLGIEKIKPAAGLEQDPGARLLACRRESAILVSRDAHLVRELVERLELLEVGKVHSVAPC